MFLCISIGKPLVLGQMLPSQVWERVFFEQISCKIRKLGHFVNLPYIFSGKNVLPSKLTELRRYGSVIITAYFFIG